MFIFLWGSSRAVSASALGNLLYNEMQLMFWQEEMKPEDANKLLGKKRKKEKVQQLGTLQEAIQAW